MGMRCFDTPHPDPSPEGEGLHFANPARGEAEIAGFRLRPSFAALVAAEGELGPLFALVERAAAGELTLSETVALLWHVCDPKPEGLTRAGFGEAVCSAGLMVIAPALRAVLEQVLRGR